MAFSKIQYYKVVIYLYFFKNLNSFKFFLFKDIYFIILFSFFRIKNKKKNNYKKLIFFYKLYSSFVLPLKHFFLIHFQKMYSKILYLHLKRIAYKKNLIKKKHNFISLTFFKTDYIFIKFSFLNLFISLDIIKFFFVNVNYFLLFYIFNTFIKLYANRINTYLFFHNLWFLTNLYMVFLDNFAYTFIGSLILKNYANWNVTRAYFFNSFLSYFYQYNDYKICYIRVSNILYIYFFCKIKYVIYIYNDIKFFLRFFLRTNFFCTNNFNFILVSKNKALKVKNLFIDGNLKRSIYKFSKYKLRLYFLFFFIKIKNNKYSFFGKKLILNIILQVFLAFFALTYKKKFLLRQLIVLVKKYLLKTHKYI